MKYKVLTGMLKGLPLQKNEVKNQVQIAGIGVIDQSTIVLSLAMMVISSIFIRRYHWLDCELQ